MAAAARLAVPLDHCCPTKRNWKKAQWDRGGGRERPFRRNRYCSQGLNMYSGMLGWRTRFGAGSAPTAASVKKSGKSLTGERLRAGKSGSWARKVRKLAS